MAPDHLERPLCWLKAAVVKHLERARRALDGWPRALSARRRQTGAVLDDRTGGAGPHNNGARRSEAPLPRPVAHRVAWYLYSQCSTPDGRQMKNDLRTSYDSSNTSIVSGLGMFWMSTLTLLNFGWVSVFRSSFDL